MPKFVYPKPLPQQPSWLDRLRATETNFNNQLNKPIQMAELKAWNPAINAPEPIDPFANGLGVDEADWTYSQNVQQVTPEQIQMMLAAQNQDSSMSSDPLSLQGSGMGGSGGENPNDPRTEMDRLIQQVRDLRMQQASGYRPQMAHQNEMAGLLASQGVGLDISPLTSLVDNWTGSNFTQSYRRPETATDKMRQIAQMQQGIDRSQGMINQAEMDALNAAIEGQKYKDKQDYNQDVLDIQRMNALKSMTPKNVGQESLDRSYAKEYIDWTGSKGRPTVDKNLARLYGVRKELQKVVDSGERPYAWLSGRMPDIVKSEDMIRWRDDVHASAQGALRATLGAQFTEKEGERIMNMAYNEKLSPAENIKKIDLAIKELEEGVMLNDAKARHFEQTGGTLSGFAVPQVKSQVEAFPGRQDQNNPTLTPGTVEDGYRYIGGDPSIQTSWEIVQ